MTYQETLDYMFNSLPMYHRIGKAAYKADITNTVEMMAHLGNPEKKFRSIHVAGTNGKGSVSHMLASVLMQAGYKVGLYTSPHLVDFRERIRVNGQMIDKKAVSAFVEKNKDFFDEHELSFFEMTVGMAFDYFAKEQVDIAVIEVGMGGRLDSTNVIAPEMCVITNISFDHTQFLGDTLAKIAGEKAGIIKSGVPVVIGQTQEETKPVFEAKANEVGAPIVFADQHYKIHEVKDRTTPLLRFNVIRDGKVVYQDLLCPLAGSYQLKNLATLFEAMEVLMDNTEFCFSDLDIRAGIRNVVQDTGLHGRWEILSQSPLVICETAHNEDGIRTMLEKLEGMRYEKLHLIYGCVNDKDFGHILGMLPKDAIRYYTKPNVPRGLEVDTLAEEAAKMGFPGTQHSTLKQALAAAKKAADPEKDFILITGSIFLVADAF